MQQFSKTKQCGSKSVAAALLFAGTCHLAEGATDLRTLLGELLLVGNSLGYPTSTGQLFLASAGVMLR